MKFCPDCGTPFEPDARFCIACGFDQSSLVQVEPENQPVQEITNESLRQDRPACPVCGCVPEPGARFCGMCGSEITDTVVDKPELLQPVQFPDVIEVTSPPGMANAQDIPIASNHVCPHCGSVISAEDRFCAECGLDTSAETLVNAFAPVDQPEQILNPATAYIPPPVAKTVAPAPPQQPESVIPEPTHPVTAQSPVYSPPIEPTRPASKPRGKKKGLKFVMVALLLAALGAAGWYGYNEFIGNKTETTVDMLPDMSLPPVTDDDTLAATTETSETPETPAQEAPKQVAPTGKTMSKIDQELARQRTKEQNRSAEQTGTSSSPKKQDFIDKALANSAVNEKQTKVIYEVGRNDVAKSKYPKNPTKLIIRTPTMIVRITTDHYNNGMGTKGGGTITVKDNNGNTIGVFKAYDRTGKNGTPNAKWVAEPRKMLEKGTYYISDSDMQTWSKTFWGTGFVIVEGYETE